MHPTILLQVIIKECIFVIIKLYQNYNFVQRNYYFLLEKSLRQINFLKMLYFCMTLRLDEHQDIHPFA